MDTRNFDYITAEVQQNLDFIWTVEPTATTVKEWQAEVLRVFDTALNAFGDVLKCSGLKLSLQPVHTDRELSGDEYSYEYPYDYQEAITISVQSEDIVSITDLEEAIASINVASDQHLVPLSLSMNLTETQAKVFLNQGFVLVDQDCEYYWKRDKMQVIEETPDRSPTTLQINHTNNFLEFSNPVKQHRDPLEAKSDTLYEIEITTTSDIWTVGGTGDEKIDAIGQINRARLNEAATTIQTNLDVLYGNWVSVDFGGLRDLFTEVLDYSGPPPEELIRQYRVNWVESKLRDKAAGGVVNGERVVSFGQVPELVFPAEIRARVEAYVQDTDSTETIDRVRVATMDETQLEGLVTEDGIEWEEAAGDN